MTKLRKINVSQVEGDGADDTNTDYFHSYGDAAFYPDSNGKLTLMMFDGTRTHRDSKVLAPGMLYGSGADSSDTDLNGDNYDTIKLIPDAGLYANDTDQFIIVDATGPNHIHLRAGGPADNSGADLILGAELTNVTVSDSVDEVIIKTTSAEKVPTNNRWRFNQDGTLQLPISGANLVSSNDITVSKTNLRMTRGSTWTNVYGDGQNRNAYDALYDLAWSTVDTDKDGNYYVGGESGTNPEAMIAKFGPDGDLIWKRVIDSNNLSGWHADGVAYNPDGEEVAVAVSTDAGRTHDYYKVTVFNSDTGIPKRTFDVYDLDGHLTVRGMTWHPTLGYVLVGDTVGEFASTAAINPIVTNYNLTTVANTGNELFVTDGGALPSVLPQAGDTFNYNGGTSTVASVNTYSTYYGLVVDGATFGDPGNNPVVLQHYASGVGIIELPRNSVKIGGAFPSIGSGWLITGTNITSPQEIQAGVGLYQNVAVTATSGIGSGMAVSIRVDYTGNYYENFASFTTGADYVLGDTFKILGSLLGGVDGGPILTADIVNANGAETYFSIATYPTLDTTLNAVSGGAFVRYANNGATGRVTAVRDVGDGNWGVAITITSGGMATTGAVTFFAGNDLTGTVVDNSNIDNTFTGVPNPTANYRLDMGYTMGYGSTNFAGGTFTITAPLGGRAFVWTEDWVRFYNPKNSGSSFGYGVVADPFTGGLVVCGQDDNYEKGFVWKLSSTGATTWLRGIDGDNNTVRSAAVSAVDGAVYFTTNWSSLNKFTAAGTFVQRLEFNGMIDPNDPEVKIEQDSDGTEYVYLAMRSSAAWMNQPGFVVSKFNSNLGNIWSRSMWYDSEGIFTHYDQFHTSIALGRDKVSLVGYGYMMSDNWYNGVIVSMDASAVFFGNEKNGWTTANSENDFNYIDTTGGEFAMWDFIADGATTATGSTQLDNDPDTHSWTYWTWKSVTANLNLTDNGIVGVESIKFTDGGKLDHNPADIPPAVTDFANRGWYYTLQLSDRGRFIKNQEIPNVTPTQDLYITVPGNGDVPFPVGSIITLINTSSSDAAGYRIYVQPENWNNNDSPQIWASSGGQNYSTWSFQGIQTATLMKIGSNEWLLTCENVTNED
jgi:hypothetical protein